MSLDIITRMSDGLLKAEEAVLNEHKSSIPLYIISTTLYDAVFHYMRA